jgi:hypothetical protein
MRVKPVSNIVDKLDFEFGFVVDLMESSLEEASGHP